MIIAIINNNEIQEIGALEVLFSNVSFPASGPSDEWYTNNSVIPVTYWREYNPLTEELINCSPYMEDGIVYAVRVGMLSGTQLDQRINTQWTKIRYDRDNRLKDTDWVSIKYLDINQSVPIEWSMYRQALRDITLQEDPFNIVWPNKPE